ncbi:hypothetical protein STEG23_001583 [Scotinomys teguina]
MLRIRAVQGAEAVEFSTGLPSVSYFSWIRAGSPLRKRLRPAEGRVSPYNGSGCSGTCRFVGRTGLKLRDSSASASRMLELKECTTPTWLIGLWLITANSSAEQTP